MSEKDPPKQYKHYLGKYIRATCHPSSVTGVILDDMYVVDSLYFNQSDQVWYFIVYNVIPKKYKKHSYLMKALPFTKCLKTGVSYNRDETPLDWNSISEITIDDVRQRRNELKIKQVMEA